MKNQFHFEKLHGAGNDFLFINSHIFSLFANLHDFKNFVTEVCKRTTGIGADGIVVYHSTTLPDKSHKCEILIVNSDGSFAATCGNALRCLGLLLLKQITWNGTDKVSVFRLLPHFLSDNQSQLSHDEQFLFSKTPFAYLLNGQLASNHIDAHVSVSMGTVNQILSTPLESRALVQFGSLNEFSIPPVFVQLANPHWVFISSVFSSFDSKKFTEFGIYAQNALRNSILNSQTIVPLANIGMLTLNSENNSLWDLTVYERGAGLTSCCGSGATAASVALTHTKLSQNSSTKVQFKMPGGIVEIEQRKIEDKIEYILNGPAQWVFIGSKQI